MLFMFFKKAVVIHPRKTSSYERLNVDEQRNYYRGIYHASQELRSRNISSKM